MIKIRGARTHNLRNIDVDLPSGKLIVMTGVSGSGKSSLAFDTLFAEGQRRYLEAVSVQTRSLLHQLPRPDADEVSGLPPTISVDQRMSAAPVRSTLAMTTEIYDYLRLLYARAGTAHCTNCGEPVTSQTVDQILQRTLDLPERSRLMILSPLVRGRRGAHTEVFERIGRNGFVRARVDGDLIDISDCGPLNPSVPHTIDAIVDRIVLKDGIDQRLRESIELACRESDGSCIICRQTDDGWSERMFSIRYSCAACDLSFPTPEPRIFSFNSAWGACAECRGLGVHGVVDDSEAITAFCQEPCPACNGTRLQPFARRITFLQSTISQFTSLSVDDAAEKVHDWQTLLNGSVEMEAESRLVAARTLPDIARRLACLQQVGVGYLNLDRVTRTLSGGEFQRARLAACLGSGLHGACFVLDEPTAGLHPFDTNRLIQTLQTLRDEGATVVVVEHDGDVMRSADWLIDLGPNAGADGGMLLFAGDPKEAAKTENSPTGQYLRGELTAALRPRPDSLSDKSDFSDPLIDSKPSLAIHNACLNNLQNVSVRIPLNQLVCVTGISGSGKSSLIIDTLLPVVTAQVQESGIVETAMRDARCGRIDGLEQIRRIISLDSSPPGRNSRSCLATISGLWDHIRRLFAKTRDARSRGFSSQRFSFNAGEGRCAECRGTGIRNLQMRFLPDATIPCPGCRGRRFGRSTLAIRFAGRTVADILAMRVDEAADFFCEFELLHQVLRTFSRVGLGYLTLGQSSSTFSGGESQRVRLATELALPVPDHTLYVLDEPTCGLHPADVVKLLLLLQGLVDVGHSVLLVEHNTDMMMSADWLIDLGPGSGPDGGQIMFSGTPKQMLQQETGLTAKALQSRHV